MRIRTAPHTLSLDDLRSVIMYPLIQCRAEPLAANHIESLDQLRIDWDNVAATKIALDDKTSEAQARVYNANSMLSRMASRVSKAILTITRDDRDSQLYVAYFGKKTLSRFNRAFGAKLAAMRGWVAYLQGSEHPTLEALAAELEAVVSTAEAAVKLRSDTKLEKRYFSKIGDRQKLVDRINAVCKSVHGELSKLPHEMPGLPNDFADRFFLSESRKDDETEDEDAIETAKERIAALAQELAEAHAHLDALEAEMAAAEVKLEKEKADLAALEAERTALAALEAEVAEKAKAIATMEAKIESK